MNKKVLNFLVIVILSFATFWWTFLIFHYDFDISLVFSVIILRIIASYSIFSDYNLSWSKSTTRTFLMKSFVYIIPFVIYATYYYGEFWLSFLTSELFLYLFVINFMMYSYNYLVNKSKIKKNKNVVIYGSGNAGLRLENEFKNSEYKVIFFVDDDKIKQNRSIDSIQIISPNTLNNKIQTSHYEFDMLVIAIPNANQIRINEIYENYFSKFKTIKILSSLEDTLVNKSIKNNLKDISVEDLLARRPQDLDKKAIKSFIKDKIILVTGAGGSIGSECVKQCIKYEASLVVLVDNSEYNLYKIHQDVKTNIAIPVMQSILDKDVLRKTFQKYKPDIVIHAAAYKHVFLCELNIDEAVKNNIIGTKNIIDIACEYNVKKVVLTSTDKAVRPTNIMGATKRVCELYAQNIAQKDANTTEIVSVRFGNVLGSSGSVIPKFKAQIADGKNLTVTHKDVTRYFMLIPEACELVLQAGSLGRGGEIFILDMGEPIKIYDLAKKMIKLSAKDSIDIEITGLRMGEKLYEELLIDDADKDTKYTSIMVAKPTIYDIDKLNKDIEELSTSNDKISKLKEIVPEFNHRINK